MTATETITAALAGSPDAGLFDSRAFAAESVSTPPTDEERAQIESVRAAAGLELLRDQRRRDNHARWDACCPLLLQTTDWTDPRLAPYSAQIAAVRDYKLSARGLIASGDTGRGKSRAMWSLMHRLGVEDGNEARYWTAQDWFSSLQENLNYGRDNARGWVETVARRHVVFIDDLGQEAIRTNNEEWASGWFFRFLDIRVGLGLPLFVTTNLSAAQMASNETRVRANPLVRRLLDLCEPVRF
jgi:hypothetical protein